MTKLTQKQLLARDAKRDFGDELLKAVRDIKANRSGGRRKVKVPSSDKKVELN